MKLANSSGDHPEEDDGSNQMQRISPINTPVADDHDIEAVRQKLMTDLRAAAETTGERERPDAGNNGDKKPSEEEDDSNPAATAPWTLHSGRAGDGAGEVNLAQPQRRKFSIALSREEIETDFTIITGAQPPTKPKKRPRAVQKEIDDLFPGSWLTEITPDKYKVQENPDQSRVRDKDNVEASLNSKEEKQ